MPATLIRGAQVLNGSIQKADLDTTTTGQAVTTRIVAGTNVTISSSGIDAGTGDVTINVPGGVTPSAHASTHVTGGSDVIALSTGSNAGLLRAPSGLTTDVLRGDHTWTDLATAATPTITSVRLRSYNSVGNPNFEIDQRNVGNLFTLTAGGAGSTVIDRWVLQTSASAMRLTSQQISFNSSVPGTNFVCSSKLLRITLTTAQASLAAGDYANLLTQVEGPMLRELIGDVHSVSILCRSSVANLKFGLNLQSPTGTIYSLSHLCTLGAANTWVLFTIPAIPLWSASATWPLTPGSIGYYFQIILAAGTTNTISSNDTWVATTASGAVGQSNFAASAVNSTFDVAFVQHSPGSNTDLMDLDFQTNLRQCQRYYCKSYSYSVKPGTNSSPGCHMTSVPSAALTWTFPGARFPVTMAKQPTVTFYAVDGTVNAVTNLVGGANITGPTPSTIGDGGFSGPSFGSAQTSGAIYQWQYTADTGF